MSASHGPRSTISVRAPRATSGGSGDGGSNAEPTICRKARRNASGSCFGPFAHQCRPFPAKAATAGSSGATRVAGGSITVSERSASGRAAAASSVITPPYE
jgi:hypothetical protein